jgi:hypothetical protein
MANMLAHASLVAVQVGLYTESHGLREENERRYNALSPEIDGRRGSS